MKSLLLTAALVVATLTPAFAGQREAELNYCKQFEDKSILHPRILAVECMEMVRARQDYALDQVRNLPVKESIAILEHPDRVDYYARFNTTPLVYVKKDVPKALRIYSSTDNRDAIYTYFYSQYIIGSIGYAR